MSGQRIEIEADLRAGDERPADTVAALPDRRSIMKVRREPRRSRRRVGRLLTVAVLMGVSTVAALGLLVQTLREAGLPGREAVAQRPVTAPEAQWLDWRARVAVVEDLKSTAGAPSPAVGPAPPAAPADRATDDLGVLPPAPPGPLEIGSLEEAPVREETDARPAIALALPDEPEPPRREDFVETVPLTAGAPDPAAGESQVRAAPAAQETPAVATGRVIASTQTPLPPRRPSSLTTPQRQASATSRPDAQAERTATRPVATRTRVFVHYSALDPAGRLRAEAIARSLAAAGFEVADLRERSVEIMTSNVRYYHPEDRGASSVVRDIVEARFPDLGIRGTALRDFAAYPTPPASGVVELWLASVSPAVEIQ